MTLRDALALHLGAHEISLRAWCRALGWHEEARYVSLSRWFSCRQDPRTGRAFSLPAALRLEVADAMGFRGEVLTPAEKRRFGPSSSGSSSQEGEEEGGRAEVSSSPKKKKKSRRGPPVPTKRRRK